MIRAYPGRQPKGPYPRVLGSADNCVSATRIYNGDTLGATSDFSKISEVKGLVGALNFVDHKHQLGWYISEHIIRYLLQSCSSKKDLAASRKLHSLMVCNDLLSDAILGDFLIRLYASCGSLLEANLIFCKISKPSVYTWYAIMSAHALQGESERTLELYAAMLENHVRPNQHIFSCTLKACGSIGVIEQGKVIHDQLIRCGFESDVVVGSTLIDMYAKGGLLEEAQKVFYDLPNRNVVSWGAMLAGYAQHGYGILALNILQKMQCEGIKPNKVMFLCVLKVCGSLRTLEHGKVLHYLIIRNGLELDMAIGNTLVDMYAKCGGIDEAQAVFDNLQSRNVVSWSAMIAGYAQHENGLIALDLFDEMQQDGIEPNRVAFACTLKACGSLGAIEHARMIHDKIIKSSLDSDVVIGSSLIDIYARCGGLEEARKVFDEVPSPNVVLWAVMISGYAQHGLGTPALELFRKMQKRGIKPDTFVFSCILKACGNIGALEGGQLIHNLILRSGLEKNVVVGSTLVDMYVKCGHLKEARKVFDDMPNRNEVTWGSMIGGYTEHEQGFPALELFKKMLEKGVKPDKVRFLCILKACGSIGAVRQGNLIHDLIIRSGLDWDEVIGNAILDMYVKGGRLGEASKVFGQLQNQGVVSWGAMIAGFAQYGNYRLVRQSFVDMQQQGVKPNEIIYTSILSGCSHAGLVEEGYHHFTSMQVDHGISPSIEHFNCIVDLLGRAGRLKEAEKLLEYMPDLNESTALTSLLSACRTYGNNEIAKHCFDQLVQLDPSIAAGYVTMSNVYADAHMWEGVERIQELKKSVSAWKKPGRAWIEVNNRLHEFVVVDKSHLESDEIYANLRKLTALVKDNGYVPQLDSVWELMPEKDEECAFGDHSEKLELGFEVATLPEVAATKITKNPVYLDCDVARMFVAMNEKQKVIQSDAYCVHDS